MTTTEIEILATNREYLKRELKNAYTAEMTSLYSHALRHSSESDTQLFRLNKASISEKEGQQRFVFEDVSFTHGESPSDPVTMTHQKKQRLIKPGESKEILLNGVIYSVHHHGRVEHF